MERTAHCLLLLTVVALVGCAGQTPLQRATLVSYEVPADEGRIEFMQIADWLPGSMGFNLERSMVLTTVHPGKLLITEKSVIFLEADRNKADVPVLRIPRASIANVSLDEFGRNQRLVIQERSLQITTFEAVGESLFFPDNASTVRAAEILRPQPAPVSAGTSSR